VQLTLHADQVTQRRRQHQLRHQHQPVGITKTLYHNASSKSAAKVQQIIQIYKILAKKINLFEVFVTLNSHSLNSHSLILSTFFLKLLRISKKSSIFAADFKFITF
jgi:hypothetical protein